MRLANSCVVENRDGAVRLLVETTLGKWTAIVMTPERARNLVYDLNEAADVAELENDEWKQERIQGEVDAGDREPEEPSP